MTYYEILSKVSVETGLPRSPVCKVYRAYWKSIREHITALPLKEDLTEEKFLSLQPNVNIPSIGKLHVTLDRYKRMKKMYNIKNKTKEEKYATCNQD